MLTMVLEHKDISRVFHELLENYQHLQMSLWAPKISVEGVELSQHQVDLPCKITYDEDQDFRIGIYKYQSIRSTNKDGSTTFLLFPVKKMKDYRDDTELTNLEMGLFL